MCVRVSCCAGPPAALARTRPAHARAAMTAEAEVALAMRDLGGSPRTLLAAADTLQAHSDPANALQARPGCRAPAAAAGQAGRCSHGTGALDTTGLPPALLAVAELSAAELAMRSLHTDAARSALARAHSAATRARVPALLAEVGRSASRAQPPRRTPRGAGW